MPRSGTLVICVQNLDFSGANQVVLNIVAGRVHHSNIVVLSPKMGTFAARFVDSGAAVRVGDLEELLNQIRDVFCIICNTIMTANIVVEMVNRVHPVIWILHEWWDDEMISENLKLRNYKDLTLQTVKTALAKASMVVFVCESQRKLYNPTAPSSVIFVGVPDPLPRHIANGGSSPFSLLSNSKESPRAEKNPELFTFLCLGIVCPRKNQLWTVQLFKEFAKDKPNVRLKVVGARYTRVYEIEYLEQVKKEIDGDPRIELLDVTDYVDVLYQTSDALILTSLNEVTPMVISEALSWSLPVLSTNIAGIKEMFRDGKEGYLFEPGDATKALAGMESVYSNKRLRHKMAVKARVRFERAFDLDLMVNSYQELIFAVAPPVILLDMDGVVVDWDGGFHEVWKDRCPVDRTKSYYIEDCVEPSYRKEAIDCFKSKGFFLNLKPMDGALEAIREMQADGLQIYICTSPVRHSVYCAQEKIEWVTEHLGEEWIDKIILCQEKSSIVGDILIDDKPFDFLYPKGKHTAAPWKQVLFDAPYNNQTCMQSLPRLTYWQDWRTVIYPMMGKTCLVQQRSMEDTVSFPSGGALVQIQAVDVGVNSFRMGMNDIGFGRDRSETTESQLIEGVFLQPHLDLPPVGRPIGMVKLRRSEFTDEVSSVCSDTTTSTTTAGGAAGAKSRSLSAALTADDVQRGVDMMLTEQGKLRPEDIATILSGSMSLMSEDNDDACSETGSSNHPGTGNVTSGAGSVKSTVGGDRGEENNTSNEAMRALASAVACDGIAGANPEGHISNSAAAQAVGERNELAERLTAAAEKKNADHNASVQSNQHKQALDSDVNEQEGLQLFRRAYALWKGRPTDKSPR